MPESAAASPPPTHIPTHAELFFAFLKISISGFGGTLPWTRRMFVEQKRWMTDAEFNDAYAVCQFLPGPNIVNLASVFGARMRGPTGSLACWTGFLGPPFLLMLTIGILYAHYGDAESLRRVLGGIAAAAAGIMLSTVVRMAVPLFNGVFGGVFGGRIGGDTLIAPLVMIATFAAVALLRLPLLWVLVGLVPVSIALAWWVQGTRARR